jgi:hypothetical protein
MTRNGEAHVRKVRENARQKEDSDDNLTEAQREFAKLLGRLLSDRWREENMAKLPEKSGAREIEEVPKP